MKNMIPAALCLLAMLATGAADQAPIQFNDNGAWSWFSDERAVLDLAGRKLLVGSNANPGGPGGEGRAGGVEVVIHDLRTGASQRHTLARLDADDHNAPALLVLPDGRYLAMYAGHNRDHASYWRIFAGGAWGPQRQFDWTSIPGGSDFKATYSNLWYLASERRVYNFVRANHRSPNLMVSDDGGETFRFGGQLTQEPKPIGYVNGYFKYWGNGVDRIDFIGTEHHPRDFDTSIYHGYIQGGRSFDSAGRPIDPDISDQAAPSITRFTKIFAADTVLQGVRMTRAWMCDLQRYEDGTIAVLFKARADDSTNDQRLLYARFDGAAWKSTPLAKAGASLFPQEQDYVGLGALHPNDPSTLYISTPIDPRDGTTHWKVHEIFQGTTSDHGASFSWMPVTQGSSVDNLRPIVPSWDAKHTALLWWRGRYARAQLYDAAVVGLLEARP